MTGTLTIGSGVLGLNDFVFTDLGGLQNGTYTLISSGAAVSGTLDAGDQRRPIGLATGTLQISGSGTNIELVVSGLAGRHPYDTWATGSEPFDGDANGDGVVNGLAWILGAANPAANALGKLPTAGQRRLVPDAGLRAGEPVLAGEALRAVRQRPGELDARWRSPATETAHCSATTSRWW